MTPRLLCEISLGTLEGLPDWSAAPRFGVPDRLNPRLYECIAAAGALLHQKVKVQEMAEVVFAHPTISESLKESAEDAMYQALHLPPRKVLRVPAGAAT